MPPAASCRPTGQRLANGSAYTVLYERERLQLLSYAEATP